MPVFIIIAAAAAAAHHFTKNLGIEEESLHPIDPSILEGLASVDLLSSEERFIGEQPIRTISFYQGNPSDAASKLWDRLDQIVSKNPWLCGCLVKESNGVNEDGNVPIRIWYDKSGSASHPAMFQFFPRGLIQLCRSTPYAELESVLGTFDVSVKPNRDVLNKPHEPLFRVSVIPEHYSSSDMSPDGFALVVSMSNALGDDYTFFRLCKMLTGSPIVSLNPTRVKEFDNDMNNLMGENEAEYVAHITADPSWEKLFINDGLAKSDNLQGRLFEVSTEWIIGIKRSKLKHERKVAGQPLFTSSFKFPLDDLVIKDRKGLVVKRVTTNDIIVSWFWNLVQPEVGLLEVNLREQIKEASANHAGNYTNSIAFTPEDYKTPEKIEKSLVSCCRVGKESDPPTILPRVRVNTRFSIVSNHLPFSQFKTENGNGESETLKGFIMPIRQTPLYFANTLKEVLPKRMSFLDLFEISQDKVGCFLVAPADLMSKIETCGIVDEMIFSF